LILLLLVSHFYIDNSSDTDSKVGLSGVHVANVAARLK